MSGEKQSPNPKRKVVPVLGAAGLSLSLAGGASAATGGPAAEMLTRNTGVSYEITLREEEVSDVSLATFYVFDKENPGTFRPGVRFAVGAGGGCWTGTYYTSPGSGNDAYRPPPRPIRPAHGHALKHAPKSP
jgi:hypothetical protein